MYRQYSTTFSNSRLTVIGTHLPDIKHDATAPPITVKTDATVKNKTRSALINHLLVLQQLNEQ